MTGDTNLIRISASSVDEGDLDCPERLAVKARPAVFPQVRPHKPNARYDRFPLGRVMEVLDSHEFTGSTLSDALRRLDGDQDLHPGTLRWIGHAAECYVASAAGGADEPLEAVPHFWVTQVVDQRTWEMYAWGRRYQSADGSRREFRFLRFGHAGEQLRAPGQTAIAAYTTATGAPAAWPKPWKEPFRTGAASQVKHVRVVEVGMLDGSHQVLFEGSTADATAYFAEHGRPMVKQIVLGGTRTPGPGCVDCKELTACGEVTRAPQLLGIPGQRGPLRTFSISDGRYHGKCPAQQHLRSLRLPKLNEYGPEAERGKAVHAFLEAAHGRVPHRPCHRGDVPSRPDDWIGGSWRLTGEIAQGGSQMLTHHRQTCPYMHREQITQVRLEPQLSYYDTATNVMVIAKPDMLYAEGDAWVWREIKTKERHRRMGADMLQWYPQLALGVLILAKNLLDGDPRQHRIELETLTPDSADIELLDVGDPLIVAKARVVVAAFAESWHRDEPATTRPGDECPMCPVRMWCPDFPRSDDHPPIDDRSA